MDGAKIIKEVLETTFKDFLTDMFEIDDPELLEDITKEFVKKYLGNLVTAYREKKKEEEATATTATTVTAEETATATQ